MTAHAHILVRASPVISRLRTEVRAFLAEEQARGHISCAGIWDVPDAKFSKRLGEKGWIGMTWPERYGGRSASQLERFTVVEELVSFGAPVWAHWLADRQIGPMILRCGTETQKQRFLPRIAAGECFICVGMSEPDAGSDLAAVRTKAIKVDGGWRITGRKVWTSYAHSSHYISVLTRTAASDEVRRHEGLSQFLVDLTSPGVSVRPILNLAGRHDLNEVILDEVLVGEDGLLGRPGDGWSQITSELAQERAGPERWLSTFQVVRSLLDTARPSSCNHDAAEFGRIIANLWSLRCMSASIASSGEAADPTEAALVKDVATCFEQRVPEIARTLSTQPSTEIGIGDSRHGAALHHATLHAPSYSLRGGAPELLRGLIARSHGLR